MTDLNITDRDGTLVVKSRRTPALTEGILSAAAAAVCVGLAGSRVLGRFGAVVAAALAAALGFCLARRTREFELRVTGTEFQALGKVGDQYGDSRSVSMAEVRWLEYQEDTTGPETAQHPGGLYAVLKHRSVCLLPDVDDSQAAAVIERIEDQYPDRRAQWAGQSAFGSGFTSLGAIDSPE